SWRLSALGDCSLLVRVLHEKIDAEQRLRVASSPTADLPFRPDVLHIRMLVQIEKKLVGSAIKLLREGEKWLRAPIGVVSRAPDRNIQALLFDNASNSKGQQQQPTRN